jgi:uncharacterized membrane protein YgaE (UPF0421/DUF939 family)
MGYHLPPMSRVNRVLNLMLADPRPVTQGLRFATMYASQAVVCCAVLWVAFSLAHAPAVSWAMISAILVLQPQLRQSLSVAATRIAANLVGAGVGLAIGSTLGEGIGQVLLGVAITSVACGLMRLDLGLRTACVATVIVMNVRDGPLVISGAERAVAVTTGCAVAVALQLVVGTVRSRVMRLRAEQKPAAAAGRQDQE